MFIGYTLWKEFCQIPILIAFYYQLFIFNKEITKFKYTQKQITGLD